MKDFLAMPDDLGDEFHDNWKEVYVVIADHMKGTRRTPLVNGRLYNAAKVDIEWY